MLNKLINKTVPKCSSLRHKRRTMFYGGHIMNKQFNRTYDVQQVSMVNMSYSKFSSNIMQADLYTSMNSLSLKNKCSPQINSQDKVVNALSDQSIDSKVFMDNYLHFIKQ